MIGLVEAGLLAGTLLAAATWAFVVLFVPGVGASDKSASAARRLLVSRAWLLAPFWVPALLVLSAMVPGVVGALAQHGDHCLVHGGHHHHLCLLHPPHAADNLIAWLVPLGVFTPAALFMGLCVRRTVAERRLARSLVATSRPSELGRDVRVLDGPEPLAVTVGWFRPTVLLSEGLLSQLTPRGLEVVLAHERAHVERGDTRHALIDRLAASLYPRAVAGPLIARATLAREQACDALAARRAGGPLAVAETLAEILRLGMRAPAVGVSVASGAVESRVEFLLSPPPRQRRWRVVLGAVVVALAAAGTGPVHTAVERLITFLLH